jgi:hypothetical protein
LLAALTAAAVLAGLVLVLVAVSLRSGDSGTAGSSANTPSATASSAQSPTPSPDPTTPQEILAQMDAVIGQALAAGGIEADSADSLRQKINDLRDHLDRGKLDKRARDLQRLIDELRSHSKIDASTADQLTTLLRPLIGAED